jgi:hypothetical protein
MSNYTNYDKPILCPYCGEGCHADWVDVGVGMVQCGPYRCENCHAYELASHMPGEGVETWTEKEHETGWREPAKEAQIACIRCHKTPDEIEEYVELAKDEEMTPIEFVIREEGTYNAFLKGKFYCTSCYIEVGQPTIKEESA